MVERDTVIFPLVPSIAALPLKRILQDNRPAYACAIAHRLATQSGQPPGSLARAIAAHWTAQLNQAEFWQGLPLPTKALPFLQIQATDTGLIQIGLPDPAIAHWLDWLVSTSWEAGDHASKFKPSGTHPLLLTPIFAIQHAHARCCSLLRLADRHHLITLNHPDAHPLTWEFFPPEPIAWLTATGGLNLPSGVDRAWLNHLFAAIDEIWRSSPLSSKVGLRLATDVSQAFQAFHRAHPLFGQTRQTGSSTRSTLSIQLGLLLATQRVLHCLLVKVLGVPAPIEL